MEQNMALKFGTSLISKYAPASTRVGSPQPFATAGRPLHKEKFELKSEDSIKQLAEVVKEINKQDPKTMEKITDAAEAVKEGAKEVRRTIEFIRDTTKATVNSVSEMSKNVTDKVLDVAETATGTPKGTMEVAIGAAKKIKVTMAEKE